MKTVQEFKDKAKEKGIKFWNIHDCSFCGYKCGYLIENDEVSYDSGCGCSYQPPRPSNWESLANQYNRNQPENNPQITEEALKKMNDFWGFENK